MMERQSATETAPTLSREAALAAVEQSIRDADPCAFPVASRIVRRVIRDQIDLPGFIARVPHRKSFIVSAEQARSIVANDELGLDLDAPLPEKLILLARPEEHELERMTVPAFREYLRRLHFHARIHVALDERLARGDLDERQVGGRIEQIGYTAFDEIRTVLKSEAFLLPRVSNVSIYVEFAAVFLELRYFAPDVLASYFPSLDDFDRIEGILAQDVDADAVLQSTAELEADESFGTNDWSRDRGRPKVSERRGPRSERAFQRLLRDAAAAAARGNDVRAAIRHARAADSSELRFSEQAAALASDDVDRLAKRLRKALSLDERVTEAWRELMAALLAKSAYGFWNPDARLLYDLQKVCLDFERDTYVIDLDAWVRSFGKRPLKRPLPAQREVLMSKHLRVATARLAKVHVSAGQREHLSILLRDAAHSAEESLRERLRPILRETLVEVGFMPANRPERVSFRKIVEELLDAVVETGFFTMGDMRDAIARNNVKLDDVADPVELFVGDRLLRADRRLSNVLDGVYQPGAFYLRWLQRISSCAFGTPSGRFLTLYAVIPFGGAFVILSGLDHLIHLIEGFTHSSAAVETTTVGVATAGMETVGVATEVGTATVAGSSGEHLVHRTQPYLVLLVGLLLLGLIHNPRFRDAVRGALRGIGRGLRYALVELPHRLAEMTRIDWLLRSPAFVFFRKRLLNSLLLTALFCWLLPILGFYRSPETRTTAIVFVALAALLNSRAGRDIEELTAERLQLAWHRIRVHVFVALFDLVMDSFKQLLEWIERLLYEVDEWLRFRSGETGLTLAVKAVLGLAWSIVRFFVRFFVTVLIEPQINPIKHFPVVTVSHKIILPMGIPLSKSLVPVFGPVLGSTIATTTVFLLPGVFGFLVWELRGNWRLYAVNRHQNLRPVVVGSHGETLRRLIKLGVHSGTLPRLYARLRRAARRANPTRRLRDLMGHYSKLHHLESHVRHFFDRELLAYVTDSKAFAGITFEVGAIDAGTSGLRVEIRASKLGDESLWIAFEEEAGQIIAGIWRQGWVQNANPKQRSVLAGLLVGFYRISGVDLVREQILTCLGPQTPPYDVTEAGLVLLPSSTRDGEVVYHLDETPQIIPKTTSLSESRHVQPLEADSLVFGRSKTLWSEWVHAWAREESGEPFPELAPQEAGLISPR